MRFSMRNIFCPSNSFCTWSTIDRTPVVTYAIRRAHHDLTPFSQPIFGGPRSTIVTAGFFFQVFFFFLIFYSLCLRLVRACVLLRVVCTSRGGGRRVAYVTNCTYTTRFFTGAPYPLSSYPLERCVKTSAARRFPRLRVFPCATYLSTSQTLTFSHRIYS